MNRPCNFILPNILGVTARIIEGQILQHQPHGQKYISTTSVEQIPTIFMLASEHGDWNIKIWSNALNLFYQALTIELNNLAIKCFEHLSLKLEFIHKNYPYSERNIK